MAIDTNGMGNTCHKAYLSCSGSAGGAVTPESTRKAAVRNRRDGYEEEDAQRPMRIAIMYIQYLSKKDFSPSTFGDGEPSGVMVTGAEEAPATLLSDLNRVGLYC